MFQRLRMTDGVALLGDVALEDVLTRLEAGEAPHEVRDDLKLDQRDLVEALAAAGLGADDSEAGPPLVQQSPPRPMLALAISNAGLSALFPSSPALARLALRAGLCQILDFWDASHEAAQEADDRGERDFSAYWHGIAHRREPDASNASYWFRRVGRHGLFPALARSASALLEGPTGASMAERVIKGGAWDPFGFIEVCTRAKAGSADAALARRLQRLEMLSLLDMTCQAALGG
jgi:hypothetical protein